MKKALKITGAVLAALVGLVAVALLVLTVAEYKPAEREKIAVDGNAGKKLTVGDTVKVLAWNIGYGALGDNADFFMDGGTHVQTADASRVKKNLEDITAFIQKEEADLILAQETDLNSDRSHHVNELEVLSGAMTGYTSLFAYNYKPLYVPFPLPPLGHVESGLVTLSAYPVAEAERVQLPCPFSWPIRLANLKRCLLVSRIPLEGSGKELVLVNLHLEAYDDGSGKAAQTAAVAQLLREEAEKGNYVIAGGDFNQLFSNVETGWEVKEGLWAPGRIDVDAFGSQLHCMMDARVPTCRSLDQPYAGADQESFQYYLIDGFIVSDNLEVENLETVSLGFTASDHNPVRLTARLREMTDAQGD